MKHIKNIITLIAEPRGLDYRALLYAGIDICTRFSLTQRHEQDIAPEAAELLVRLKPFMYNEREVSEWPGTKLFWGTAILRDFALSEATCAILRDSSDGLYDWCQPTRLEDLVLWRADGDPWLVSIAHERDAYLCTTLIELNRLFVRQPSLKSLFGEWT